MCGSIGYAIPISEEGRRYVELVMRLKSHGWSQPVIGSWVSPSGVVMMFPTDDELEAQFKVDLPAYWARESLSAGGLEGIES